MKALCRFIFSVLLAHVALPPAAAQEHARGAWRATNNDSFIQAFVLGDRAMASVSYSNGVGDMCGLSSTIIVSSRSFTVVKNWSKVSPTWRDAYDHSHA